MYNCIINIVLATGGNMRGYIFALLAMVSYSSTPTFTQVGYKGGIQTNTLLFARHLVSFVFLLPTYLRKGAFESVGRKQVPGILILSAFAVAGNIMFNYAYHYLTNMVAVSVSLSYVVFVLVIELVMGREKFTPVRGLVIALTVISMVIIAAPGGLAGAGAAGLAGAGAVGAAGAAGAGAAAGATGAGAAAGAVGAGAAAINMKAFVVGLIASASYAGQIVFINSRVMRDVPSNIILLTGILPIMVVSFIWCVSTGQPLLPTNGTQCFAILCLGTIGVIVARGLFFESSRMIGASTASMIDSLEPVSSAVLGYVLLGQVPTVTTAVGSALLTVSVVLLLRERQRLEAQG